MTTTGIDPEKEEKLAAHDHARRLALVLVLVCLLLPAAPPVAHGQTDSPQIVRIKDALQSIGLTPVGPVSAANGLLNWDVSAVPDDEVGQGTLDPGQTSTGVAILVRETREALVDELVDAGFGEFLMSDSGPDLGSGDWTQARAQPSVYSDGVTGWRATASSGVYFFCGNLYVSTSMTARGGNLYGQESKAQAQAEADELATTITEQLIAFARKLVQALQTYNACSADDPFVAAGEEAYATIVALDGDVVAMSGSMPWATCTRGQRLGRSAEIHTGPGSRVTLMLPDGHTVELLENTQIMIGCLLSTEDGLKTELLIKMGEVRSRVEHREAVRSDFSVRTPVATVGVRGTVFTVRYDPETEMTTVSVEEGEVVVTPTNALLAPATLAAGQGLKVTQDAAERFTLPGTGAPGPVPPGSVALYVGGGLLAVAAMAVGLVMLLRRGRRPAAVGVGSWVQSPVVPPSAAWTCSRCGQGNIAAGRFCARCGAPRPAAAPAAWTCSRCGQVNRPEFRFCSQCGSPRPGSGQG